MKKKKQRQECEISVLYNEESNVGNNVSLKYSLRIISDCKRDVFGVDEFEHDVCYCCDDDEMGFDECNGHAVNS